MDMKYTEMLHLKSYNTLKVIIKYFLQRRKLIMFKFLANVAEKYAKATNTSCLVAFVFHQPKMPVSMIKKD